MDEATSDVPCTVDFNGAGKQLGHFALPWSRNESGWGNLLTPIAVIANGDGPTILLTGGNHGDEFEGPAALRRLITELEPDQVTGRIIIVPGLNHAALKVGRRLSPIDNGNLNRLFPGDPLGTTTQRVAAFVYRELVRRADIVLDFHSGGESMIFAPLVATHRLDDHDQVAATAPFIESFGAPFAVVAEEPDPAGLLDDAVESLGKIFITTEICGGRTLSAGSVDIAYRGATNTLKQAGVLKGTVEVDASPTYVEMVTNGSPLAPFAGLFEPLVDPGTDVVADQLLARVHSLDDLRTPPAEIRAPLDGLLLMRHSRGLIDAGDPAGAVAIHVSAP